MKRSASFRGMVANEVETPVVFHLFACLYFRYLYTSQTVTAIFVSLLSVADAVEMHDPLLTKYLMSGERGYLKPRNTVPHDVGDPGESVGW